MSLLVLPGFRGRLLSSREGFFLSLSSPLLSASLFSSAFSLRPPPLGMRGGIYSVNMPPLKASNEDSESIIFP